MTEAELVEAMHNAHRVVEEAGFDPNTAIGVAAFEQVLGWLLRRGQPESVTTTAPPSGLLTASPAPGEEIPPVSRIATWSGIAEHALLDYIEFGPQGAEIQIPARSLAPVRLARQRQLALTKLTVDRVGYERAGVQGVEINALCERYDCLDQNLPSNLDGYENYISRRGRPRSYVYRLTQFGLGAGRDLLRDLFDVS